MPKAQKCIGYIFFVFVCIVYAFTASKTINFWDSPEFVASNAGLQITHPPGAPFYTILCKVILSFTPTLYAAYVCTLISSFFGALTVYFLYLNTHYIVTKIQQKITDFNTEWLPIICGLISALSLAFCHSFWIASTETEVYTLSFALLMMMLYVLFKWEAATTQKQEHRYLLLLGLLLGISTGVHLITISIIVPLSLLFTQKKFGLTITSGIISLMASSILFLSIYSFGIQGLIKVASKLDIWLVNTMKFSVNSGSILLIVCISIIIGLLLWYSHKKRKAGLNLITLVVLFFLVGISSYALPIARYNAHSLVSNAVQTNNRLLQYIKAEQFGVGNIPLLYGPMYNAQLDKDQPFVDGSPVVNYDPNTKQYITTHDGKFKHVNYASEFKTFFPRMYDLGNEKGYKDWTVITGDALTYPVKGVLQKFQKPTFAENLTFFWDYQVHWLNLRYLFWNFVGRQNDNHGLGYIKDGNWVTGINSFDKRRIGDQSMIPEYFKKDKSYNVFYGLPFLLGILGLFALRKHRHYFWMTLIFFLTFGLGITLYVNPLPASILVRERDYIFIGSFIMFALWIGLSVVFFVHLLQKYMTKKAAFAGVAFIVFCAAPFQLFAKGWDDHQRSHDTFAYDLGKAYLDACPEQAILISNGDNMTFPLWYLQEVENYRTDVRVLNFDQLNLDSNINDLKRTLNSSKPIQITLKEDLYRNGDEKLFPLEEETKKPAVLPLLFEFLNQENTRINWNGRMRHYIPSTSFSMPIDTLRFKNTFGATNFDATRYVSEINWQYPKKFYGLNELVLLNIISNNIHERPICFAINGKSNHYIGLQPYTIQHGLVEILAPIQRADAEKNPKIVDTEMMYPYLMETVNFKGLNDPKEFIDYENKAYAQDILRRNYYFLAQALFEEGAKEKALKVLDRCMYLFPHETVPYKQYAFGIGRLYSRIGAKEKGVEVCTKAMQYLWDELQWMASFDPPHATINVRHATRLLNMYKQMRTQFPGDPKSLAVSEQQFVNFQKQFAQWQQKNWPY